MDMMLSVLIQNPNPDDFQNITVTSSSEDIPMIKFLWRSDEFFSEISAKLWKNKLSYLAMLKNHS